MNWRSKVLLLWMWVAATGYGTAQHTVAEQYLFQSINAERAAAGLPALVWSSTLTQAAQGHALKMRSEQAISHRFAGEPDVVQRAATAGTRFSRVAENVATSGSVLEMHDAWMRSLHHRENILDPQVNSVGIAVVTSGRQMWGVEDFARDVAALSFGQQEAQLAQLVMAAGIPKVDASDDARATCRISTGFVGARPAFVVRFTASDLRRLPAQLTARIAQGDISTAAVGACAAQQKSSFTTYNAAVLLYR